MTIFYTKTRTKMYDSQVFRSPSINTEATFQNGGSLLPLVESVTLEKTSWDWRAMIRSRQSVTSQLSGTRYEVSGGSEGNILVERGVYSKGVKIGTAVVKYRGQLQAPTWNFADSNYDASLTVANNRALMALNRSISSAMQDLQGLTFAGEIAESLRMIRHPAAGIRHGLDSYLATLKKRAAGRRVWKRSQMSRMVSETWLEYAFGWRPLLSDVKDGAKALANALHRSTPTLPVQGVGKDQSRNVIKVNNDISFSFVIVRRRDQVYQGEAQVRYHGVVGTRHPSGTGFDFSRFGTSWSEIPVTIWELIPYSFVADYFTNIGDIITAFSQCWADVKWLEKGTRLTHENSWRRLETGLAQLASNQRYDRVNFDTGSKTVLRKIKVTRTNYTHGGRIPSFAFEIPGMGTKWINLSALLLGSRSTSRYLQGRTL